MWNGEQHRNIVKHGPRPPRHQRKAVNHLVIGHVRVEDGSRAVRVARAERAAFATGQGKNAVRKGRR